MARLIIEVFGRVWLLESQAGRTVKDSTEDEAAEFENVPVDPHGTLSAHIERGAGADSYTEDITGKDGSHMEVTVHGQPPGLIKFGFGNGR